MAARSVSKSKDQLTIGRDEIRREIARLEEELSSLETPEDLIFRMVDKTNPDHLFIVRKEVARIAKEKAKSANLVKPKEEISQ